MPTRIPTQGPRTPTFVMLSTVSAPGVRVPADRRVPLMLLPCPRSRWSSFTASFFFQALIVVMVVGSCILWPQKIVLKKPAEYRITQLLTAPPPQHEAAPVPSKLLPPPPRLEAPQLVAEQPPVLVAPAPKAPEPMAPRVVEVPRRTELANVVPVPPTPAKPAQIVHTGEFSTGSQAVPTIVRPPRQVQTGGFGDPEGIGGEGKAGAKLVAHAVGAFDLPGGPGNGNGTGGDRGVRGTVASTGFGTGVANGDSNQSSARAIQRGGFGDVSPAAKERPVARRTVPEPGPETPVQILSKPVPVYTEEARRLRLEGNVLLEVAFSPNGQCKVLRVVRGLGYGLDEAAARAAQQISFRPATRNGQPVESSAVIRVVFQLAY